MADFIKDLLNVVIQHSKNLLPLLELATTLVILLVTIIILLIVVLAVFRPSKYKAKHSIQKMEVSEVLLISALDLVINAISLLQGR
ncbi:MAG: hypothetical protein E6465_09755 [Streptococcus mitis]|jgi:hypothetical protein|nr:hypothetical protein [Streptococcus mitis]